MVDSSHSSEKGRAYNGVLGKCSHQTLCLNKNVSFPNMHTLQTQTVTKIVALKFVKKEANKIVWLVHVIKMYLHRKAMALFWKMINIWRFDTWTWPSGIAVVISCLLLWIHNYNRWHKCITIYTVNSNSSIGQISHNVPITSELRSFLCDPHYRPPLITTIYSWTWRLIQIQSHCHCLNTLS